MEGRKIVGRHVALRPVIPADYELFYVVEMDPRNRLHRFRGATMSPEDYVRQIWTGTLCQYTVVSKATGEPLGLVTAFSADMRNQHCRVAALLLPEFVQEAWPVEGISLFVDHLFSNFPLRKIYGDVLEPNLAQFASLLGSSFSEEGRLEEHEYIDGKFVALVIIAIYRSQFYKPTLAEKMRATVQGSMDG